MRQAIIAAGRHDGCDRGSRRSGGRAVTAGRPTCDLRACACPLALRLDLTRRRRAGRPGGRRRTRHEWHAPPRQMTPALRPDTVPDRPFGWAVTPPAYARTLDTTHNCQYTLLYKVLSGGGIVGEVLYVAHVDAVLDPGIEAVGRCTLAAIDGRCRVLADDDTGPGPWGEDAWWMAEGSWPCRAPSTPTSIGVRPRGSGGRPLRRPRRRWSGSSAPSYLWSGRRARRTAARPSRAWAIRWIGSWGMRAAVAGGMPGPRVCAVGPIFTAPGGHPAGDTSAATTG